MEARAWYGTDSQCSRGGAGASAQCAPTCINWKWMDVIYPYVKSTQVFTCPDDHILPPNDASPKIADGAAYIYNRPGSGSDDYGIYCNAPATSYGTYAINAVYVKASLKGPATPCLPVGGTCVSIDGAGIAWNAQGGGAVALAEVADPAGTFWVGDGEWSDLGNPGNYSQNSGWSYMFDIGTGIPKFYSDPPMQMYGNFDYSAAIIAKHLGMANILFCDGHVKSQNVANLGYCTTPYSSMACPMLSIAADGSPP